MSSRSAPNSLALLARRCWRRSPLSWLHFRWTLTRDLPHEPGLFRQFERRLRHQRKRLVARLGGKPLPALPGDGSRAVAAAPSWSGRDGAAPPDFALYVNSHGNYFFREMAELLRAGLRAAGWTCDLRSERDGPARPAHRHVVFAPHEFFFLAEGWRCFERGHHGRLFLLNTEQTHTKWFRLAERTFFLARHLFDMSDDSARVLRAEGYSVSQLRFGHVGDFPLYDGARPLPELPEVEALPAATREWRDDGQPLAARPLDVSFFGEGTTRRARLLAALAPTLQGFECFLRLKPQGGEPWRPDGEAEDSQTQLSAGITRRAKVMLNLHRNEEPYFEWHRIVLLGLWQRALVLSEPVTECAPFVAGRDFIAAPAGEWARLLEYHLRDPWGIAEAEAIRAQGHRTLREQCDFARHLREIWAPFVDGQQP